ncbi:Hypothetical predicted protein [Olea europaea subsp. europaea]|uniref:Uncharacterized protein n=1 Tax=Olea europaea subsp. europaea TaxID=158383 RepID=A0A8S0TX95_OLEEU|nr:Hypothetical predicted protein [Olea europaea subsp. europaea]
MEMTMLRAVFMFVAVMAICSAAMAQDEFGMSPSPAPAPDHGAGYALLVSAAVVGSSLVLSLLALIKN